jgi:glycosyltransferase involved in cell wall biosynthesis
MENLVENKILFVIWGLRPGGAEGVFVNIVNNIGFCIKPVVCVLGDKEGLAHNLKDNLRVFYLRKKNRWDVFRLIMKLSLIIRKERPERIVGFGYYANHLVILARYISGLKIPVFINERTETASSLKRMGFRVVRNFLLGMTYKMADRIIAVSHKTRYGLISHYGLKRDKITVIHNPIDFEKIEALSSDGVDHPWFNDRATPLIIAVGRLIELKGFFYLIKAFSLVSKEIEKVHLAILGKGPERAKLENLILNLDVKDKVILFGYQQNPFKYMAKAQIFVLSSFYEGLPNVVLEAMACEVPVISTLCPSGLDEIITDGFNGLLVPTGNEEALARAMLKLLKEPEMRYRFLEAGRERVRDFSLPKIINEYENLLN